MRTTSMLESDVNFVQVRCASNAVTHRADHRVDHRAQQAPAQQTQNPCEPELVIGASEDAPQKTHWKENRWQIVASWVAGIVGVLGLVVAMYYGYWSFKLQRWQAQNDFRDQCRSFLVGISEHHGKRSTFHSSTSLVIAQSHTASSSLLRSRC